jgi:phospholipase/carboxylesterase
LSVLEFSRRASVSGTTTSLVVFLHGYGADGKDLLGLANSLSPHMKDTVFVAPNAPHRCSVNPTGFEWFPIPWIDGSSEEDSHRVMQEATVTLNKFLDELMEAEGVTPAATILVGFSQGTMISLHIAPRRDAPFAAVVGFSGRLLDPESLHDEVKSRMPILLVHGDADDVVPPSSMPEAANVLAEEEFEVYTHIAKGTGHGISPDGMGVALQLMSKVLSLEPAK